MKLKSNLTYVYKVGNDFIMPGINYFDNLSLLEHPHIQAHIEHNTLELLSDLPTNSDNKIDYENMNAKDLVKEIKDIYDLRLLEKIKKGDNRKIVIDAVNKQLESFREENKE